MQEFCLENIKNLIAFDEVKCNEIEEDIDLKKDCLKYKEEITAYEKELAEYEKQSKGITKAEINCQDEEKTPFTAAFCEADSTEKQNILYDFNQFDDLLAYYEDLYEGKKQDVQFLNSYALTLVQKGSLEMQEKVYGQKALALADEVLAMESKNAEALYIRGYANEIQENYAEALSAYDQALEINSENALVISQKGHAYRLMGEYEKAKEYFQQALAIDPDLPHALLNLGNVFLSE